MTRLARAPRPLRAIALIAGVLFPAAPAAHASPPTTDARWLPWIGCWIPSGATDDAAPSVAGVQRVCVTPAEGSDGVDVVSLADGRIASRIRIEASGERRPLSRVGCTGWESARWSADAERLYLRSELTCAGNITRTSSGIIAIASPSDWVDVQVVSVGDQRSTRILRYRSVLDTSTIAREIAASVRDRELARQASRLAAASSPTIADVVEASREVDASVVEAWLLQRMPRLAIDGRKLTQLADARVPGSVIDLVVALATPERFGDRLATRGYTFLRIDARPRVSVDAMPSEASERIDEAPSRTVIVEGAGRSEDSYRHRHHDGCGHYGITYMSGFLFTPGFYPYWLYPGSRRGWYGDDYYGGYDGSDYYRYDPYARRDYDRHDYDRRDYDRNRPTRFEPAPSRGQIQVIDLPQRRPTQPAVTPTPEAPPRPSGGRVVNGRGYTRPVDDATSRPSTETRAPEPAPPRRATRAPESAPAEPAVTPPQPARGRSAQPPPPEAKPAAPAPTTPTKAAEPAPRTARRRPPGP